MEKNEKWQMPEWMKPYEDLIINTGGNSVEELVSDNTTNVFTNVPRAIIVVGVKSQVALLIQLYEAGHLAAPALIGAMKAALEEWETSEIMYREMWNDICRESSFLGEYPDNPPQWVIMARAALSEVRGNQSSTQTTPTNEERNHRNRNSPRTENAPRRVGQHPHTTRPRFQEKPASAVLRPIEISIGNPARNHRKRVG